MSVTFTLLIPMIVKIMSHSNAIHLANHMAALLIGFFPDSRKREEGSSLDFSFPGIGLLRTILELSVDVARVVAKWEQYGSCSC